MDERERIASYVVSIDDARGRRRIGDHGDRSRSLGG
jgi:hypothetical protein